MSAPRHPLRLASSIAVLPLATLLAAGPAASAIASTPQAVLARTSTRLPATRHLTSAQAKAAKLAANRKAHHAAARRRITHTKLAHKVTPTIPVPASAPAPVAAPVVLTPFEARMVFLVNNARVQNGFTPLTVTAGTTDVARHWAVQLAGDDSLSHNPNIVDDLEAAGSPNWTFLAENVGTGSIGDADGLFTAYMNSPHHRANILDPRATSIGMGAVAAPESDGDAEWNVIDFVDSYTTTYGSTKTNGVSAEEPASQLMTDIGG